MTTSFYFNEPMESKSQSPTIKILPFAMVANPSGARLSNLQKET